MRLTIRRPAPVGIALLLLLRARCCQAECSEVTRQTLYGDVTLKCSGRGACVEDKCECEDGAVGAAAKRTGYRDLWWQVEPSNIVAPGSGDCGGTIRANAPPELLTRHWVLLFLYYFLLFAGCGWLFGPETWAKFLPPQPRVGRFTEEPWRLPVASATSGVCTLAATIFGALFAGALCGCYWPGDFDHYNTISALAEHPPMTVITPLGVLITSFFATAQVFAAIKHAASLPCYQGRCAKLAFGFWCFVAFQAVFWGIGVNVFFNESWDHDSHIELSLYYFVAAGFNNVFLYFGLLPRIWAEHRRPLIFRGPHAGVIQLAFHGVWISPAMGLTYQWVYESWGDKPPWALGVYEHAMSAYQLISFGIVLHWFLRPTEQPTLDVGEVAMTALGLFKGLDLEFMGQQQPQPLQPQRWGAGIVVPPEEVASSREGGGLETKLMPDGQ